MANYLFIFIDLLSTIGYNFTYPLAKACEHGAFFFSHEKGEFHHDKDKGTRGPTSSKATSRTWWPKAYLIGRSYSGGRLVHLRIFHLKKE